MNRLTSLGAASIATLCLVWSGLASAGEMGPMSYTTMSRASVLIQSNEQTGEGTTGRVTVRTNNVINSLRGEEPGTRVPGNLMLVLLNSCDYPMGGSAVTVWDRNEGEMAGDIACLYPKGAALFNERRNTIYQQLHSYNAWPFHMDEIDMDVEIRLGKVGARFVEENPVCLRSLSTLAMSGYYGGMFRAPLALSESGPVASAAVFIDEDGSRVMRRSGSIKTNGFVFDVIDGDVIRDSCSID